MGTCNCRNEQTAQPEVDMKAERSAQKQAQEAGPTTVAEVVDPFQFISTPQPTTSPPKPIDVLPLQSALRGYLDRKTLRSNQENWLDFETGQAPVQESSEETNEELKTLLTTEAAAMCARLPAFIYPFKVRNVATYPPQRLSTGGIYIGQWASTSSGRYRQGKGTLYTPEGGYIEGYWQGGKPHYSVRIIYPNGDFYEGQCQAGVKSGTGRFATFDGSVTYTGEWAHDRRNGSGTETSPDGTIYTGNFRDDAKTGIGKFQWSDGSWYSGDLLNGEIDGQGEYHWGDGRTYTGQWKSGKMHGKGEFLSADGKRYVGDYVMDKREGQGVYTWGNNRYDGQWLGNKMHGIGLISQAGGEVKKFEFRDGSKVKELL